jgi:ricin-type beta-trefoil lectin protein
MRTVAALSLTLAATLGACTGDPEDGLGSIQSEISPNSLIQIKSFINQGGAGKCLDVAGGYTSAGTPIVQFSCHGGTNQRFSLSQFGSGSYQIHSALDQNMCVGYAGASPGDGVLLRLEPCKDTSGTENLDAVWTFDPGVNIFNPVAQVQMRAFLTDTAGQWQCVDVASGLNWDSLWMQTYHCHGGPNQQWLISNP